MTSLIRIEDSYWEEMENKVGLKGPYNESVKCQSGIQIC